MWNDLRWKCLFSTGLKKTPVTLSRRSISHPQHLLNPAAPRLLHLHRGYSSAARYQYQQGSTETLHKVLSPGPPLQSLQGASLKMAQWRWEWHSPWIERVLLVRRWVWRGRRLNLKYWVRNHQLLYNWTRPGFWSSTLIALWSVRQMSGILLSFSSKRQGQLSFGCSRDTVEERNESWNFV